MHCIWRNSAIATAGPTTNERGHFLNVPRNRVGGRGATDRSDGELKTIPGRRHTVFNFTAFLSGKSCIRRFRALCPRVFNRRGNHVAWWRTVPPPQGRRDPIIGGLLAFGTLGMALFFVFFAHVLARHRHRDDHHRALLTLLHVHRLLRQSTPMPDSSYTSAQAAKLPSRSRSWARSSCCFWPMPCRTVPALDHERALFPRSLVYRQSDTHDDRGVSL